ncbi:anoctamin-like protein [Achlya hypogyna]|uniref:Anoctamin-like protein n=1 Tax=Achlya hypogyna TaxID=1202772 RepID=A0A1V9ZNP0_ACHHY|nr:anoctamin-like protein [Achlya hypogyna]
MLMDAMAEKLLISGPSSSHRLDVDGGDDWAFVVVFPNKDPAHIKLLLVRLQKAGLQLKLFYSKTTRNGVPTMVICKLRAKLKALEAEAARINLPMLMDASKLEALAKRGIQHDDGSWSTFEIGDKLTLHRDRLTPYEYIHMKYDTKYTDVRDLYARTPLGGIFTSVQRMMLIESIIANVAHFNVDKLKASGEILDCFPLHNVAELKALQAKWVSWSYPPWGQPIHDVKNYFGTKVALYFAYLGYYTTFLGVSGSVGLGVFALDTVFNQRYNSTAPDAPGANYVVQVYTVPLFGAFMALWATLFLEGWKRRSAVYALHWGTTHHTEAEAPRPQFHGVVAKSPIDGSAIKFFSDAERFRRRVVSWLVLFVLIGVVLLLTAAIFFLRYYMLHVAPADFMIHVHGHDFAYGGVLASTVNLAQIFLMYKVYDRLSLRMNDYENHATESSYEANYILKAILFHFINSYAALIYVASLKQPIGDICAYGNCFDELRYSLIVIYGSQIVVGNVKEVLVPRFWAWLGKRQSNASSAGLAPAEAQFFQSHYGWKGTFDDFLEMILQFGYSTFFVVSFPLTPLLSFVNNVIEIRVDGYRLTADCRRPRPRSAANIGLWIEVLEAFVTIAIVTNGWVIFYTHGYAGELVEYLQQPDVDVPLLEFGLFVGFVTSVLLVRAALATCIPDVPGYVQRQLQRQAFLATKVLGRAKPDDDEAYTIDDQRAAAGMKIAPVDDDP